MNKKGSGDRFNAGKLRYELLHPNAIEDLVRVLTKGAEKYSVFDNEGNLIRDGGYNWRGGLSWTSVIASLKRHIAEFEKCKDFDSETGEYHIAHAAANIHYLNAFYYIFPEGDDRVPIRKSIPKIALDIDGVICDFTGGWADKYNTVKHPNVWCFDRNMNRRFNEMKINGELTDFYLNLKPLIKPDDLPFEPAAYVTHRPVEKMVSEKWIDCNGFPQSPVYCVGIDGESKSEILKKIGVNVLIDDHYENFIDVENNGLTAYLFDNPYNRKYDVGHFRIKSLKDLPWFK